ncbi:DNRLRE domain-containing protein [candidate division KSB1 bacterium]
MFLSALMIIGVLIPLFSAGFVDYCPDSLYGPEKLSFDSGPATTIITYQPDAAYGKDTYIDEANPNNNMGITDVGVIETAVNNITRTLVEMDTIQNGLIPANATITRARLVLTSYTNGDGKDSLLSICRLTEQWDEGAGNGSNGDVSWNERINNTAWTDAGGTFGSTKYGTKSIGAWNSGDTLIFDITDLVRKWYDGTFDNHGMILKFDTEDIANPKIYTCLSDHATGSKRPKLIVEYFIGSEIDSVYQVDSTWHSITVQWDTTLNGQAPFDSFAVFTLPDTVRISPFTSELSSTTFDTLQTLTSYSVIVRGYKSGSLSFNSSSYTLHTSKQEARIRNLVFTDSTGNSVTCTFDTLLMGYAPFDSFAIFLASDSVTRYSGFKDSTTITSYDTLTVKTDYIFFVKGFNADTVRAISNIDQIKTFINFVPAVSIIDTSDTTITFLFDDDGNPDTTYYVVFDSVLQMYIDPAGNLSVENDSLRQKSLFDTLTVSVDLNTYHEIFVNAFDENLYATGYFHSAGIWSWAQAPEIDSVFAVNKDSIFIRIDPLDNPDYTLFAFQDSLSDCFIERGSYQLRSPNVTADSLWAWGTYQEWGGASGFIFHAEPNTIYVFRGFAQDGKR